MPTEVEGDLWKKMMDGCKEYTIPQACKLIGWPATLSYTAAMKRILIGMVNQGLIQESINPKSHSIVYRACRISEAYEYASPGQMYRPCPKCGGSDLSYSEAHWNDAENIEERMCECGDCGCTWEDAVQYIPIAHIKTRKIIRDGNRNAKKTESD